MTKAPKISKKVHRGLGRGLSTLLGDTEARTALEEFPIINQQANILNNASDKQTSNAPPVE